MKRVYTIISNRLFLSNMEFVSSCKCSFSHLKFCRLYVWSSNKMLINQVLVVYFVYLSFLTRKSKKRNLLGKQAFLESSTRWPLINSEEKITRPSFNSTLRNRFYDFQFEFKLSYSYWLIKVAKAYKILAKLIFSALFEKILLSQWTFFSRRFFVLIIFHCRHELVFSSWDFFVGSPTSMSLWQKLNYKLVHIYMWLGTF